MDEEAAVLLEVHSTTKDANESSDGMGEWEDERCGIASDDGVVGAPGSSSSKSALTVQHHQKDNQRGIVSNLLC